MSRHAITSSVEEGFSGMNCRSLPFQGSSSFLEDGETIDGLVVAPTAPLSMRIRAHEGNRKSFQTSVGLLYCTVGSRGDAFGGEMFTAVLSFIDRAGFPGLFPRPLQLFGSNIPST